MCVCFCQDDPGSATFRAFASAPSSSSGRSNSQTAPPASIGPASVISRVPVDVCCEVAEVGRVEGSGQVVSPSARCVDAFISDVIRGASRDELSFSGFACACARNGDVALSLPALMSLAEFISVPSPGKVAQCRAVVPDYVDVCTPPADERFYAAVG